MKNMKKIFALVLAMMLVLSMVSALAETAAAADTSVGIEGLTAGDVVSFYQVLTWNQDEGAYRLADGFTGLRNSTEFATALTGSEADYAAKRDEEIVKAIVDQSGLTQTQASAIAAYAASASKVVVASPSTTEITVKEGATSVTYELPKTNGVVNSNALGLYMGIITAGNPGYVYNPVFVGADYNTTTTTPSIAVTDTYESNGIAKKKEITVEKTTSDSNEAIKAAINSYVGEEVSFQVTTTIPVFLDSYTKPSFRIDDAIKTTGIELVTGSIEVTLGKTKYTDYSVTDTFEVTEVGKTGYNVVFDEDYLKANTTYVDVTIDYKGKITNTAEFNINEDQNEVTVTYSNGPTDEKAALRDRTSHYTFSIGAKALGESEDSGKTWELVKVAVDKDGKPVVEKKEVSSWYTKEEAHPLAGAIFGLYTDDKATTAYVNDIYPNGATFETTADGVITFKGLSEGTYYLKEISAPNGYVKDERIVKIEIECEYVDVHVDETTENGIKVGAYDYQVLKSYTVKVNNVSVYTESTNTYGSTDATIESEYTFTNDGEKITAIAPDPVVKESDLVNTPGVELPSTGGMGTTLFYIGGGILIALAVVLLVTKRRMSGND